MTKIEKLLSKKIFISLSPEYTNKLKGGNEAEVNENSESVPSPTTQMEPPPWLGGE